MDLRQTCVLKSAGSTLLEPGKDVWLSCHARALAIGLMMRLWTGNGKEITHVVGLLESHKVADVGLEQEAKL